MSATKSLPRIPTTGDTFAELVYHLTSRYSEEKRGWIGAGTWPTVPHVLACALVPISRKLHKLAERACNENAAPGYFECLAGKQLQKARDLLPATIKVAHKTDPRAGYGLGLVFPDGRTNDFGGTCIVVPCKVTD